MRIQSISNKPFKIMASLKEAAAPAIAKAAGVSTSTRITGVIRQNSILDTVRAMGLTAKVNAMNNIVAEVSNMQDAGAVLQTIYNQFGVKGSFMITWEGNGKVYWSPKTPVDKAIASNYAKTMGLPPPPTSPKGYLGY